MSTLLGKREVDTMGGGGDVQLLTCAQLFATPWTTGRQASLSFTLSNSLLMSCPLSRWCHPTISSSVIPFFSCPQSFPTSRSLQMSQLFISGGQSIGVWASVLQMNIQDWFPLGWTGWISLQSKGLSRVFSNTTSKASILQCSTFLIVQLSHPYMTTEKTIALTRRIFVGKIMPLLFNMLSRMVITFLPRSNCLLISWLQSPSAVILEPQKIKSPLFPHLFVMRWWDRMPWSSFSECWALSQLFHSPLSLSSRGFLAPLHFMP